MNNEIGNLDLTDRQLLATGAPPRKSLSREIGEATITHTIFGKAKVRIVRKHDNIRRSLWWVVLAVLLVLVALQIWLAWQQSEEDMQNEDTVSTAAPALTESVPDSTPQTVPETPPPPQPAAVVAQPQPVAKPALVAIQPPPPKAVPAPAVAPPVPARTALPKLQSASTPAVAAPRVVKPAPRPVVKPALPAAASAAEASEALSPPIGQEAAEPQKTQESESPPVEKPKNNLFSDTL